MKAPGTPPPLRTRWRVQPLGVGGRGDRSSPGRPVRWRSQPICLSVLGMGVGPLTTPAVSFLVSRDKLNHICCYYRLVISLDDLDAGVLVGRGCWRRGHPGARGVSCSTECGMRRSWAAAAAWRQTQLKVVFRWSCGPATTLLNHRGWFEWVPWMGPFGLYRKRW